MLGFLVWSKMPMCSLCWFESRLPAASELWNQEEKGFAAGETHSLTGFWWPIPIPISAHNL